jgi:hypothetical protein
LQNSEPAQRGSDAPSSQQQAAPGRQAPRQQMPSQHSPSAWQPAPGPPQGTGWQSPLLSQVSPAAQSGLGLTKSVGQQT